VYEQRGTPDNWNLVVVTDIANPTEALLTDSGSGPHDNILFSVGDSGSGESFPCSIPSAHVECCQDTDCGPSEQFTKRCVNRQCICFAARTFTLTWFGSKF
jgi:hypothetical protein